MMLVMVVVVDWRPIVWDDRWGGREDIGSWGRSW